MSISESRTESGADAASFARSGIAGFVKAVGGGLCALFRQDHKARRYRSRWWFLLPIMGNLVGGIISYCAIRHDDPDKAKNCLLLGLLMFSPIALLVIAGAISAAD